MRLLVIFMVDFLILFIGLLFIVEMRLFGVGGCWLREDPMVHPYRLIRPGLMKNSERLGFLTFPPLGKGIPALRNSIFEVEGGFLYYLSLSCLG